MDALGPYLLRVTAAAILCAILKSLLGKEGTPAAMGKLLCGVFLAVTVLHPLTALRMGSLQVFSQDIAWEASQAVAQGESDAAQALRAGIKQRVEAYILDKAASLGAELTVEVTLTKDAPPAIAQARLAGKISPYAKAQLSDILTRELGIPKEAQQWN